jgi:hypothetical protein
MEKPVSTDGSVPIEESSKSSTKQGAPQPEKPAQPGGEPASEPVEGSPKEGAWKEDYDDVIEPSEEERVQAAPETSPKEKPKKKHWAGIITVIVIIVLLLLWTLLSPKVLPPQGTTYVDSPKYASLGNFTGARDIWTGDVNWGVSVDGPDNVTAGTQIQVKVLITKVSESPSNFFFRGIGISITNCTLWDLNGTYIAKFSSLQDLGFGKMAIINTTLPVGNHDLYVSVKFTEYEVMRLGFIPLESVQVEKVFLSSIHISP